MTARDDDDDDDDDDADADDLAVEATGAAFYLLPSSVVDVGRRRFVINITSLRFYEPPTTPPPTTTAIITTSHPTPTPMF